MSVRMEAFGVTMLTLIIGRSTSSSYSRGMIVASFVKIVGGHENAMIPQHGD